MDVKGKQRPGRDADHSPPSSVDVKKEWQLHFLFPQASPGRVAGRVYFIAGKENNAIEFITFY
jgi:hypothetical protein